MSIDLGNSPVGTPPTEGEKTQIKQALGISADASDFLDSFPAPNIKDVLTITADQSPDDNAKLLMVDKSTPTNRQGALEKRDGQLLIGPDEDKQWAFKIESDKTIIETPHLSGIRFGGGAGSSQDLLNTYESGSFDPRLETGDGTIVQTDYLTNNSTYVRVGRLVFINVEIQITNFSAAMKATYKNWRLTGLPFVSQGDTHVEIRPFRGWLDLGDKNITGFISGNNDYMWFEYFKDGGTVPGLGNSLSRVNQTVFVNPPFDFTTGSFDFLVTGVYKTNDAPST